MNIGDSWEAVVKGRKSILVLLIMCFAFLLVGCGEATNTEPKKKDTYTPTSEEQAIHKEVNDRLDSDENPSQEPVPAEFQSAYRNEEAFRKWADGNNNRRIAYKQKVLAEAGAKYGKTADEAEKITSKVTQWRMDQDMAP